MMTKKTNKGSIITLKQFKFSRTQRSRSVERIKNKTFKDRPKF